MKRKILILPNGRALYGEDGENLLSVLAAGGYALPAACGGRGTCGKCRVRLLSGCVAGTAPDENGEVLACRATVCGDVTLSVPEHAGGGLDAFLTAPLKGREKGLGAVLDIGTTTLALCLVDRATGEIKAKCSALNPQGVLGADVLSRIKAWGEGKGALLQKLLLDRVREMIERLLPDGEELTLLTVAANTTMLHLFLGVDPSSIGVYPFTPQFTDTKWVDGAALGLPARRVCVLPSVSAYIGSDASAGALACGFAEGNKTELLIDIGTNGEILLSHGGAVYATSAAAGPAFEGACIECGMGGVAGAVDHVSVSDGVLAFSTVEGAPPRGICGSGLIDLIACLLREGLIDEGGAFDVADSPLSSRMRGDRFYLCEDVYLSQKDIRQYQLAKSAIVSAVQTLLDSCGVSPDAVERVLIAGGMGYYMNVEAAAATGLLPRALCARTVSVGNTALAGARLCLADADALSRLEALSRAVHVVELGGSAAFSEAYMMNMILDEV